MLDMPSFREMLHLIETMYKHFLDLSVARGQCQVTTCCNLLIREIKPGGDNDILLSQRERERRNITEMVC